MHHLLMVEDDKQLGKTLFQQLVEWGYQVTWCQSLADLYKVDKSARFDAGLIDLNLPDGTGFDVIKTLQIPVVIMTAQNSPENRLKGLEYGVFDFIPKPFLFKELQMKLEHVLAQKVQLLELSTGVSIDLKSRTAEDKSGNTVFLNEREFLILKLLIDRTPAVISRDEILNSMNEDESASHRSIDNVIVRLRQILKDEDHKYINSVRGVGYQWLGEKK